MLKIFVEIDGDEIEVSFLKTKKSTQDIWVGDCMLRDEVITVNESEGLLDEKSLNVSSGVTTPPVVIYERLVAAFNNFNEEVSAGFEPTTENINDNNTPQPYNPDDIKVRREGFSVFEINRMMTEQNDIDLNPDFQRNLVWDNTRKSALIESILLGIPIPVFYFAESKSGKYHVVDGLQRLSTIKQFFNNEFALKKLEHLKDDCNGRYYKEEYKDGKKKLKALDRRHTRRLENAQLIVNVIEFASPQKVKYDIFKRLNTGGRPLNKQEVRNCIASDSVRKFLKDAVKSSEFILATGDSINDNRMDAQELVLRFIGFKLEREGKITYTGDMNSFLDDVMDIINEFEITKLDTYMNELLNGLKVNYHLFGEFCFRKCLTEHFKPGARKQFINKALFVSWMMEAHVLDYKLVQHKISFGGLSEKLAEEMDSKGKYYTILTTGTSDKQNLKDAGAFARELLIKNNLL